MQIPWNRMFFYGLVIFILTSASRPLFGQTTLTGDHIVTGTLKLEDQITVEDTNTGSSPSSFLFGAYDDPLNPGTLTGGFDMQYDAAGTLDYILRDPAPTWTWWIAEPDGTGAKETMKLDSTGSLIVYGRDSGGLAVESIELIPLSGGVGGSILIDGATVITSSADNHSVSWGSSFAEEAYSTAWGQNALASGAYSTAWGFNTAAVGHAFGGATAWGYFTNATEDFSTAWGYETVSQGFGSTAWGHSSVASGEVSTAWGIGTASGTLSTAWGVNSLASGNFATAWGHGQATGYGATAWGEGLASGGYSTSFGEGNIAPNMSSIALGRYNVGIAASPTSATSSDALVEIGIGFVGTRRNGVTVFANGDFRVAGVFQAKAGVRVPQQGDLSMGNFTAGEDPADLDPSLGLLYPSP